MSTLAGPKAAGPTSHPGFPVPVGRIEPQKRRKPGVRLLHPIMSCYDPCPHDFMSPSFQGFHACPWPALQRSGSFSKIVGVDVHVGRPLHHPSGRDRGCRMHFGVIASSPSSKEIDGRSGRRPFCVSQHRKKFLIFEAAQRRQHATRPGPLARRPPTCHLLINKTRLGSAKIQ